MTSLVFPLFASAGGAATARPARTASANACHRVVCSMVLTSSDRLDAAGRVSPCHRVRAEDDGVRHLHDLVDGKHSHRCVAAYRLRIARFADADGSKVAVGLGEQVAANTAEVA